MLEQREPFRKRKEPSRVGLVNVLDTFDTTTQVPAVKQIEEPKSDAIGLSEFKICSCQTLASACILKKEEPMVAEVILREAKEKQVADRSSSL